MKKCKEKRKIRVEVEFTEGYQQRFTKEILKIYEKILNEEIGIDERGKFYDDEKKKNPA